MGIIKYQTFIIIKGAAYNNCKVKAGSSVAVFGLGAVGLSVI